MHIVRDGISASPGIVMGPAHVLSWDRPRVPHVSIQADEVETEIERFDEARRWVRQRILDIQKRAAEHLGPVEAQIFEPQLLMLDDQDLVDGTVEYIRDNHLSAPRALEVQMLEFQSGWRQTGHPMVMDRLNDLLDVETRLLRRLLGIEDPDFVLRDDMEPAILVASDLTPSITVQLDQERVLGIATDGGTRTSHSAILARAMGIPAVVSLGDLSSQVETGMELVLDGRAGRVIVQPEPREIRIYRERDIQLREWEQELELLSHQAPVTPDHESMRLRGNIDLPSDAAVARAHGAQGIGLFRTEFLVVGRSTMPEEEEEYRAYREVAETFPDHAVYIRTFDLGGDKFPLFLQTPKEDNPFLGWRAIRVCLDMPELFRPQLRALLRATAHGDVRIMLPLVTQVDDIHRTRALLEEEEDRLRERGIAFNPGYKLGAMIETPGAVLIADQLARHVDFFSIGTNDLVQYTLAVDRGNPRLASLYSVFHPGVVDLLRRTAVAGGEAGLEVSVCGEMAGSPLGLYLLMGLGINAVSVGPSSLQEIKKVIRSVPASDARAVVSEALDAESATGVVEILKEGISKWLDLSVFSGRWNLSGGS